MDIVAKHIPADKNGVRIAQLDEMEFRRTLWDHKPLTDFWRVGAGYAKKLEQQGLYTMGDIARCSVENENILYGLFGKNTELLIDHAWGWEPCTIKDVKNYKPSSNSLSSGQVLQEPYESEKAKLVLKEMADFLVLDLVEKGLVTNQIVVTIGYDVENLSDKAKMKEYSGDVTVDGYGRKIPKQAHGSINLGSYTSSTKKILTAVSELYDKIINSKLLIRRLNITAANVIDEISASKYEECEQLDLFSDQDSVEEKHRNDTEEAEREKKMQKAMLSIKNKFGKNAILKGMNLEQGATAKDRNEQIGGHKA